MIEYAQLTLVGATLIVLGLALYFDLRYQRIPNKLCLIALLSGVLIQSYFEHWQGLLSAFYGAGLALMILLPAYYFKLLGAGDVKLMIGVGALSGPLLLSWSLAYGIIFGVFTSILLAAFRVGWQGIKKTIIRYYHCLTLGKYFKPDDGEAGAMRVPYAPALAIGWLWACYLEPEIGQALLAQLKQF